MPRPEINDYVFYKIVCSDCPDYIYIGSTGCLNKRKRSHKTGCNNPNHKIYNLKVFNFIIIRNYKFHIKVIL